MAPPFHHLRIARPEDFEFLWLLKQQTMRSYVEQTWGQWNADEQKNWFSRHFSPDEVRIIVADGRDAGRLEVTRSPDEMVLGTIEILPEFQSRGIGSALIASLQAEAKSAGVRLRLQVLKANPRALRLYESLGFVSMGETATHYLMSWES
jgi:ribosomal protein S18 acetylase RimI-like enzyme